MTTAAVTRAYLSERVHERTGISKQQAAKIVDNVLDEIINAIVSEGSLKLASFGTFNVRQKSQRIGRNPRTKEEAVITPRKVISFKASNILKKKMNSKH